jgi:hypothetical protein
VHLKNPAFPATLHKYLGSSLVAGTGSSFRTTSDSGSTSAPSSAHTEDMLIFLAGKFCNRGGGHAFGGRVKIN